MEVNGRDPVTMTFTSHDVFRSLHVPDFPSAVIRGSSDDLLSLVEGHTTDATSMSCDLSCGVESVGDWLVVLSEEWVWSGVLWHASVLCNSFAKSALSNQL